MSLESEVRAGMAAMLARRLDYSPRPEDLPFTTQVMIEDLLARGLADDDAWRVRAAFASLGPKIQKWPTPFMVIEALPSRRPYYKQSLPYMPKDNWDEQITDARTVLEKEADKLCNLVRQPVAVLLPGEGFGEYRRTMEKSGMTKRDFDAQRVKANAERLMSNAQRADLQESKAERAAIVEEGA